jgi:DNA-binding transcriptional LysR family regulator
VIGYLESQEAIKEAVKAGLGLTVISRKAVEEELKAGVLEGYRLQDLHLKRNFYLVFRKKRILPPLSHAFLQFTLQFFRHR